MLLEECSLVPAILGTRPSRAYISPPFELPHPLVLKVRHHMTAVWIPITQTCNHTGCVRFLLQHITRWWWCQAMWGRGLACKTDGLAL